MGVRPRHTLNPSFVFIVYSVINFVAQFLTITFPCLLTFLVSLYNFFAIVLLIIGVDLLIQVFIQGRENLNRAVQGDIVAIEILPEADWTCPSSLIIEDIEEKPDDDAGPEV